MNKTKFVVRVAMCVALLIAAQLALTSVNGIEIVTVMLLCFCYCYGVRHGVAIATTFSLLRCFFFGFQIIVYGGVKLIAHRRGELCSPVKY